MQQPSICQPMTRERIQQIWESTESNENWCNWNGKSAWIAWVKKVELNDKSVLQIRDVLFLELLCRRLRMRASCVKLASQAVSCMPWLARDVRPVWRGRGEIHGLGSYKTHASLEEDDQAVRFSKWWKGGLWHECSFQNLKRPWPLRLMPSRWPWLYTPVGRNGK